MPRKNRAVLTDTIDNAAEVSNRIAMAMKTAKQLMSFRDKANTTTEWKLQVFNAVVQSKIHYGLETMQLTRRELNKLVAFQMRNLRRILKIQPTFVGRTQTNEKVRDKVLELEANQDTIGPQDKRTHPHDPLRQVIFEKGTNTPKIYHCKRVADQKQSGSRRL